MVQSSRQVKSLRSFIKLVIARGSLQTSLDKQFNSANVATNERMSRILRWQIG
jgi:hypothetical protein